MGRFVESDLVERHDQLGSLEAILDATLQGSGRIVHLTGPVASGKTTLVRCLETAARDAGMTVLRAIGSRAELMLPLGVVAQLLDCADLTVSELAALEALLDQGARAPWSGLGTNEVDVGAARVLRGLCVQLLTRAERGPVVAIVDDAHLSDAASLQCLSYLGRRLASVPMLVVLVESPHILPACPAYYAELAGPHVRALQIGPLTPHGVARIVDQCASAPPELDAQEAFALTGGSPLLLRALLEGQSSATSAAPIRLGLEDAFGEAILRLLYRSDPLVAQGARAIAVMGASTSPELLARLLEIDLELAQRVIHLLRTNGLLGADGFRDPRTPAVVLASVSAEDRESLHAQAARLAHCDGAAAAQVARYLVTAGPMDDPWVHPTLMEAADQALAAGDHDGAVVCLRAAQARARDDTHRAEATVLLVRALWRSRPADAAPHLPALADAVRAGHLAGRHALVVANQLLWHGDGAGASAVLDVVCGVDLLDQEVARGAAVTLLAQAHLYPGRAEAVMGLLRRLTAKYGLENWGEHLPCGGAETLAAMTASSAHGDAVAAVERALAAGDPGGAAVGTLGVALAAMVFADRMGALGSWQDPLPATASGTFAALTSAVEGERRLAHGELAVAERGAIQALTSLAAADWGVLLGSILATAVRGASAAGRFAAAEAHLCIPMPPTVADTVCGLDHLHARGDYYLAKGRAQAAASDFLTCRDRVVTWCQDRPGFDTWRTDLAWAFLELGRGRQSRELAEEELRRLGSGHPRLRVPALRVLAAGSDVERRLRLLREAVDLAEGHGTSLDLAYAYTDLSEVLRAVGDGSRARVVARVAGNLARQLELEPLVRRLHSDDRSAEAVPTASRAAAVPTLLGGAAVFGTGTGANPVLSDAEHRVASLAGLGYTNREIAGRLHVTVSTVEQHLTRVYRKLQVSRRTDLTNLLGADVGAPAPAAAEQRTGGVVRPVVRPGAGRRPLPGLTRDWTATPA